MPAVVRESLASYDATLARLAAEEPPAPASTMAAIDEPAVVEVPVHVRGSHLKLEGAPVARGFLSVLDHVVPWGALPEDGSGRLALADWLTDPQHPLTARVMVNRIWQHHFGQALVRSPSNFGARGATPTHPELLAWLGARFVEAGWSVKAMHRLVLTSETWQQSVAVDAVAAERDPTNELLWRQNRRRIEAEAIRDSLLAVSGRLDTTVGGDAPRLGEPRLRDERPERGRCELRRAPPLGLPADHPQRDVPVLRGVRLRRPERAHRGAPVDDRGDAGPVLDELAARARQRARALASRVAAEAGESLATRLQRVHALAFGRAATDEEVEDARRYITALAESLRGSASDAPVTSAAGDKGQGGDADERAFVSYCQAVLASNELVFVD